MTRRIRDDFEGVVHLPDGRVLRAGDEEPEGAELGDHLFSESKPAARKSAAKK